MTGANLTKEIFDICTSGQFTDAALKTFTYQYQHNPVYRKYADCFISSPSEVTSVENIPFLPVDLFRTQRVICGGKKVEKVFESSGTGGSPGRHHVADVSLYDASLFGSFRLFYGDPASCCFLALLPSYLERANSSLVYMVSKLMQAGNHPQNGFFLYDHEALATSIDALQQSSSQVILIGVSFALMDFAEKYPVKIPSVIVMETGGMKGRREEIIREELHYRLCSAFGVEHIHSEYGMTEMLSQAYSLGKGKFRTPSWMKIIIRDPYDPRAILSGGNPGLINVVDLANINSCSFLATHDIGRITDDGSFEVMGRMDHAAVRGCNLLY